MSHSAVRRAASSPPAPRSRLGVAVVIASALLVLPLLSQGVRAQSPAAAKPAVAAAKQGKPGAKAGKPAAPKPPMANKNIAIGLDAIPTLPKALLSAGCLDARHGDWLSGELGAAGSDWQMGPETAVPSAEVGSEAAPLRCVPYAAVRSPADRIESLAFLPAGPTPEAAELRRVMVVSRLDLGSAPSTSWHDFAEVSAGSREAWLPAAGVLAGEWADQVPQRWQRDVALLVRQMKKQAQANDTALVRLVLQGEGDAARVTAVELVDDTTGQAIDSAIWLERADAPGGFVSARGGDHERVLWQSPVDYRRISRGVGAATVIVRKRVFAKPKTPGGKPRMVVRSFRTRGQHQGVDFAAPTGTPVVTVSEGTVVHAGRSGGYGNLVVVDHGGGITTYYAHLSAYAAGVVEGAKVERGQEIGQVGSTGMSTGPHLHFEIRREGRYLDPADPAQSLPTWGLATEEHQAVLTRLLALSLTRESSFARATRQPALASAPQTAAAE